jgi:hypothetical protein
LLAGPVWWLFTVSASTLGKGYRFLFHSYPAFLVGFIFWGIQESFCSGSVDVLLYEERARHGEDSAYERRKHGYFGIIRGAIVQVRGNPLILRLFIFSIAYLTVFGVLELKLSSSLNNAIRGERATVLSLQSLAVNAATVLLSLGIGAAADAAGG